MKFSCIMFCEFFCGIWIIEDTKIEINYTFNLKVCNYLVWNTNFHIRGGRISFFIFRSDGLSKYVWKGFNLKITFAQNKSLVLIAFGDFILLFSFIKSLIIIWCFFLYFLRLSTHRQAQRHNSDSYLVDFKVLRNIVFNTAFLFQCFQRRLNQILPSFFTVGYWWASIISDLKDWFIKEVCFCCYGWVNWLYLRLLQSDFHALECLLTDKAYLCTLKHTNQKWTLPI